MNIEEILGPIKNAGMKTKLKKYDIFCKSIENCGHVTAPGKLRVADNTTEVIAAISRLTIVYHNGILLGPMKRLPALHARLCQDFILTKLAPEKWRPLAVRPLQGRTQYRRRT